MATDKKEFQEGVIVKVDIPIKTITIRQDTKERSISVTGKAATYLKDYKPEETFHFHQNKSGAIDAMYHGPLPKGDVTGPGGFTKASDLPKGRPPGGGVFQQDLSGDRPQVDPKKWDELKAKVEAMHPADRVQWAVKVLEDLHGVPDKIETLARLIIRTREEGDKLASQVPGATPPPDAKQPQPIASPAGTGAGVTTSPLATAEGGIKKATAGAPAGADPREVRIVRQSCLKAAVAFVSTLQGPQKEPLLEKKESEQPPILQLAELFEEWVWR